MRKTLYILLLIIFVLCIDKINAYTEYKIGDVVPYNGMDFYVIKGSDSKETSVTMLKAEPLTVEEVNLYGAEHVNMNVLSSESYYQTAYDSNGYGGMRYYSSSTCGYNGSTWVYDGCTTAYAQSEVKYVVDAWKAAKAPAALDARLLTYDELIDNLGYDPTISSAGNPQRNDNVPTWVYNSNYWYWTSSQHSNSSSYVWRVSDYGGLGSIDVSNGGGVVRPVITLKKTALGDEDENIVDDKDNETLDDTKTNESKTTVKVDNTYMSSSILLIILGFITASISVSIIYKLSNKKR